VSCSAPWKCMAAGYYGLASYAPVAESWNGASWQDVPTAPLMPGVAGALGDVSCLSAHSCLAVGYLSSSGNYSTLIEAWNGAAWQTQAAPSKGTLSELYGVACLRATRCFAVGSYLNHTGRRTPLAESWNGASWQLERLPRF
jgi:hypothetical protein